MRRRSLWLDRPDLPEPVLLEEPHPVEVLVVGAGLTGLATALLLARAGVDVAVVEARHVGAVATGNTTAKVSLLQGTKLSRIFRRHSSGTMRDYVTASTEGQQWLLRYCAEHGVETQVRPALTYAQTPEGRDAVAAEHDAAVEAGLPVEWVEDPGLPFETHGAVRLADQAQLDPMDLLLALHADLVRHGGAVYSGARVTGLTRGEPSVVDVVARDRTGIERPVRVRAQRVVLATGTPILDRGGFFARLSPLRSYALALEVPGPLPQVMALSADRPTRSLRTAPVTGGELLLVGGQGHPVGRTTSASGHVDELLSWAREAFPGARPTHVWSAQDYRSVDLLPYVGRLVPASDQVIIATGYDKWGMATGVAAALAISGQILGGNLEWAHALRPWRPNQLLGADRAARLVGGVAARMAADWTAPRVHSSDVVPPEGAGRVELDGHRPVAVSTVDGHTRRLSGACTHQGGIITWNDAERSWDCPLHGSRFAADGEVLEGPATCPLSTAD